MHMISCFDYIVLLSWATAFKNKISNRSFSTSIYKCNKNYSLTFDKIERLGHAMCGFWCLSFPRHCYYHTEQRVLNVSLICRQKVPWAQKKNFINQLSIEWEIKDANHTQQLLFQLRSGCLKEIDCLKNGPIPWMLTVEKWWMYKKKYFIQNWSCNWNGCSRSKRILNASQWVESSAFFLSSRRKSSKPLIFKSRHTNWKRTNPTID